MRKKYCLILYRMYIYYEYSPDEDPQRSTHGVEPMDEITAARAGTIAILLVILGAGTAGVRGLVAAVAAVAVGGLIVFW